jgi:Right handed beta helix region
MIRPWHTAIAFGAAMLCTLTVACPAMARELSVGPRRVLKVPSQAATVATDGDVVRIDPGIYSDCAIWTASRLVIEATGPDVVIAGKTCAGKGIFITVGADITIRGITFADASVLRHNGAGIRAAGDNLTVEGSRFLNNENGILAGGGPNSVLRITDSAFIGNGACIEACAHGVYAGEHIYLLDIERCVFLDTKIAHHIKSRARNTLVRDSRIEDGPEGTSSYLIDIPDGGNALIQGNVMEKGTRSENPGVAISIGEGSANNPSSLLLIRDNLFHNDLSTRTAFVRDGTPVPVESVGNTLSGDVEPLVMQLGPLR